MTHETPEVRAAAERYTASSSKQSPYSHDEGMVLHYDDVVTLAREYLSIRAELASLRAATRSIRTAIEQIVVTEGIDRGVVLLSHEGPTHYDAEMKCQVYDHENFSPLGDALIALYEMTLPPPPGDASE